MLQENSISARRRDHALDALESGGFDLVVIGGGITGAGVAHEASRRGLSVALLEADDFASGTSGRSSKLIHGGLRYLAMGEVSLVRQTALERKEIHRLAPHLAEPRWMVVPTRSRAGLVKFRIAIAAYEKLGAVAREDRHRNWTAAEIEREEPTVDSSRYPFACVYREYLTDDARLVLANLRSAARNGAVIVNHVSVDEIVCQAGRASAVRARCTLNGRSVRVPGRVVVNAAGPWVEEVRRLESADTPPWLHLSKGVHVVLPADRLPIRNMWVLGARDRRTIFAIPRGNVVYVGTTDTTHAPGPELWPEISSDDVEYLLEPIPRHFRVEPVEPGEVVAAWAGLRPLIAEAGKAPTEISRRDEVAIGPSGVVSIAGGKLTGYRLAARNVLERVAEVLGSALPQPVVEEALPGGAFDGDFAALSRETCERAGLSGVCAERIVRLYGSESAAVAARGDERLGDATDVLTGEVDWAVDEEGAATLEDLIYRRLRLALYDPTTGSAVVEAAAARMSALLGWSDDHRRREVERVRARLRADLCFEKPIS